MFVGWNLGNTLAATPDEGSWNNPPVDPSTFDDIKAAGFKSVRIPGKLLRARVFLLPLEPNLGIVTYANHTITSSPSWTINSTWLDRISTVIDQATERGLYVVTNMHHDSWMWADVSAPDANISMIEERFKATWSQIGAVLACK